MAKILVLEDDSAVREPLLLFLQSHQYETVGCKTIAETKNQIFDLAIIDWNLPDGEGIDLLRAWRSQGLAQPVILLTARNDLTDRVLGLELGAHDYMTKPFEPRELLARIRVQLRMPGFGSDRVQHLELCLHLRTREVQFQSRTLSLTKMEFDLLRLLAENPGKVFSRDELLNKVWGFENFPTTRTVDTHVLQLRQKTADDLIETVRGVGYRMKK